MSCSISIDSVVPAAIEESEPFRVTWSVVLGEDSGSRNAVVTLLTDDARLVLLDHGSHDSPPERTIQLTPGQTLTRTSTVQIQRRKGLVDENSRDGSASPLYVLARVRDEREEVLAAGAAFEIQVAGLAKRPTPRIFA